MLAFQLPWRRIRSPGGFDNLSLALVSFYICPAFAHVLPVYASKPWLREESSALETPGANKNFSKDFATAVGVAVFVVAIGTTLICVFAHCWQEILDWGWRDNKNIARKRRRKDGEAWFCGADRGLPMPQFDILEPESEPLALSMQTPDRYPGPDYHYDAPVVYERNAQPDSRTRSKARWNQSAATLPSWLDPEEIERPASVAYLLDRP